ncbi:PQQ-dependent sugar dehydrogenase [Croceicoccus ponticola]|uniref:PQQ-dependent sugar dehydrogenase n=1 Tax=Croceicoccus ponticola TaxID=2217664 RepID=UPI001F0C356D|nr:PQQ-dependent sugar dehydrogenase [Croceicoccus ponticola]
MPALLLLASCGMGNSTAQGGQPVENALPMGDVAADSVFAIKAFGTFEEPWAMAFVPGTDVLVVTQKAGSIRGIDTATGRTFAITGAPKVDYGGQGGLGDIAFLPSESAASLTPRTIYLSWAEAGNGDVRGAAVGRGNLICDDAGDCAILDLKVIWRQNPKVSGRGHYSHRLAIAPDGQHLFVSSGDRQKLDPAQDTSNTLGTIVRLNLDGTPAPGNPLADKPDADAAIWSWGHRNVLGLTFDAKGQLWELEHGPAGGDELNLVVAGKNYGWPVVSNGQHYDGRDIPDHATRPEFAVPVISWDPVIGPGDLLFPSDRMFPELAGKAVAAGLVAEALVVIDVSEAKARELARYGIGNRVRAIAEGRDGALWVAEDGPDATLWRLTAKPS